MTTGASGSSVLTGTIATQGYWLGDDTKKLDFNTYENAKLVDLNIELLNASGFKRRDCNDMPPPSIDSIKALAQAIDLKPFRDFIERCDSHRPWLWKDPRLCFTIHFWTQLTDLSGCRFILIDRDPHQSYAGLILNRKVPMRYKEQTEFNNNYLKSCNLFFENMGLDPFRCTFEDLLLNPEGLLEKLNNFLELEISLEHLKCIYKKKLFKKRYSKLDFLKANLIYFYSRYVRREYIRFPRREKT